jgi:hypothetical protein
MNASTLGLASACCCRFQASGDSRRPAVPELPLWTGTGRPRGQAGPLPTAPRPKRASDPPHADARSSRKAAVPGPTPAARRLRGLLRHPGHLLAAAALRDSSGSSATSIPYPKAPPRPRRSGVRRWPPVGLNVVALSGQRFPTTPARRARTSGAPGTGGDARRPDVVVLLVGDPGPVG